MNKKYDMYSDFDITLHKQTFVNYFEAILLPNGQVVYATPSHVEKLLSITKEPRDEIYDKMPITASPLHWLIEYTGCISMWSEFYIGSPTTDEQKEMLQLLIDEGLTK